MDDPQHVTPHRVPVTQELLHPWPIDEVQRLREWKESAMTVLAEWEAVWEAAGRPGQLGQSKAEAMLEWVRGTDQTEENL